MIDYWYDYWNAFFMGWPAPDAKDYNLLWRKK